jgi:hypothetical protein
MATYFWVGGTGTWSVTGNTQFAITSGGVATLLNPTSADVVTFDANSGSAYTVTISENVSVQTVTANAALSLTFAFGSNKITITGNGTNVYRANGVIEYQGTPVVDLTYSGATGTRSITPGAATVSNPPRFNITAGTDIVSLAAGSTGRYGTLNFTGFSGSLVSASSTASWTIFGGLVLSSTMTMPSQTGAFVFSATSGTQQITSNGKTINQPLTFNGIGGTFAFQDALTQGSTRAFTITNGTVQLKVGVTSTVGSLTTSGTSQKFLQSTLAGTQATLSQATGIVSVGYLTIKDINATGGATFNAYTVNSNVNAGNNLGWDFFAQLGRTIYTRRKEKRVLI